MINPYKLMNEAPTVIGMMSVVLSSGGSFEMAVRDVSENGPVLMRTLFNDITMDADCREEPYIKRRISIVCLSHCLRKQLPSEDP